ncbi:MAG TPA: hypothetical protein VFS97_01240 [Nitrososphaeraceae archaeon]|nr:hypothetical protein [Nitrososphaeraceae archaeon]
MLIGKGSLSKSRWKTVAYKRTVGDSVEMFGLSKSRTKEISLPLPEDLSPNQLIKRILDIQRIIEDALNSELRQYCFPEAMVFDA